jgi:hypothetical protein
VLRLLHVEIPWGNPTLVILITFLAGIQLLSRGILGAYLGRVYDEVRQRPMYIVESMYGFDSKERYPKEKIPNPAHLRESAIDSFIQFSSPICMGIERPPSFRPPIIPQRSKA